MSSLFHKYLLAPKILYFFLNLSSYSSQVYIVQFLTKGPLQIKKSDYSLYALTAGALFHTFGAGFWTLMSDRFHRPRLFLALSSFLYMVCFQLFFLVDPSLSYPTKVILVTIVNSLLNACQAALFPLFDGQVMTKLEQLPNFSKDLFGRQRLWGTVGHALCGLVMGVFCDSFGYPAMFSFNVITTVVFLAALGLLMDVDVGDKKQSDDHQLEKGSVPLEKCSSRPLSTVKETSIVVTKPPSIIPPSTTAMQLKSLFFNQHFTFFLFVMFITGVAKHVLSIFSSPFIEAFYQMEKKKVGLSLACHVVPEVLLFSSGKYWINTIGVYWMLIVAQLTTVVRVMSFAFFPPQWAFVPYMVEMLKGVSTACLVLSGSRIAHDLAPAGLETFAQGSYAAVFHGLANFGSGLFSGLIMVANGGPSSPHHSHDNDIAEYLATFKLTGYISLTAMTLLVFKWACFDTVLRIPYVSDFFQKRRTSMQQQGQGQAAMDRPPIALC